MQSVRQYLRKLGNFKKVLDTLGFDGEYTDDHLIDIF